MPAEARSDRVSEENKIVVKRLFAEAWSRGDLDVLDEIVDDGYRSHIDEVSVPRMSRWTGSKILKVEIAAYRSGLPDCRVEVAQTVTEGDEVVARFQITGTNTGRTVIEPMQDVFDEEIDPTDERIAASGNAWFRIEGGRIAQARVSWDPLGPVDQVRLFATRRLELVVSGRHATVVLEDARLTNSR
jgi:ketosteroid isomerase-like protein